MTLVRRALFLSSLFLANLTPLSARAETAALEFDTSGPGLDYYQNFSYSLGFRFKSVQNNLVTALGFYDDNRDGIHGNHAVGIFDASTNRLVASAVVRPTDPLIGNFRYRQILPVLLTGNDEYYAAAVTLTDKYRINVTNLIVPPSIEFIGFAGYGPDAETPTERLTCPDKWETHVNSYHGDFGPSFRILGSGGTKPSGLAVLCNRGPNPTDDFQCTATVTALDGSAPPPSGKVTFTTESGSFPYGDFCVLTPTGGLNQTSFCAVTLRQGGTPIPAGSVIPIDGIYSGDNVYDFSQSIRPDSTVAKLPKKPKVCFSEVPLACDGLNAILLDPALELSIAQSKITPAFAPVFASYYGQTPGIQTNPQPAVLAAGIKAPKSTSDITFLVEYVVKAGDNKALAALSSVKPLAAKLKAGLVLASYKKTLKYGAGESFRPKLSAAGSKIAVAAVNAKLDSLKVTVKVQSIRKGDKAIKTFSKKTTLLFN